MGKVPESRIVKKCLDLINSLPNCLAIKRHGSTYTRKGEPDITGSIAGLHLECEVKVPGEEPTKLQAQRLREWLAAGALSVWVTSPVELAAMLARELTARGAPLDVRQALAAYLVKKGASA